jgi:hypothetical protein
LNDALKVRASEHVENVRFAKGVSNDYRGSTDFNVVLINYMQPAGSVGCDQRSKKRHGRKGKSGADRPSLKGAPAVSTTKRGPKLRNEPDFDLGLVSVSWHMDSSLQPWSTIAVYHQTSGGEAASDWRIALRVQKDATTPALCIPLKSHQVRTFASALTRNLLTYQPALSKGLLMMIWNNIYVRHPSSCSEELPTI